VEDFYIRTICIEKLDVLRNKEDSKGAGWKCEKEIEGNKSSGK
jgi:hypothetical protein